MRTNCGAPAAGQRRPAGSSAETGMDERVQRIWDNSLFQEGLRANRRLEQDRIFCKHDSGHLLDVARIAWIENLETGAEIPKYLIYAAALLHDIGRHLQYTEHVPHHEASARLAERILPECGFSQEETEQILRAILHHRDAQTSDDCGLAGLIYRADKRSRCCFACPAEAECDWDRERKNLRLVI